MQRIAIAVTTAPRGTVYLGTTLRSLAAAGAKNAYVFAEPDTDLACLNSVPSSCAVSLTKRVDRRGNFRNWMEAAKTMLATKHEYILMAEDDVLFGKTSLGDALEVFPRLENAGFLSLYTPTHYQMEWQLTAASGELLGRYETEDVAVRRAIKLPGSHVRIYEYPEGIMSPKIDSLFGALALLFHRDILAKVVEHDIAKEWKDRYRQLSSKNLACVDSCIGEIMNVLHLKMWYFNPGRAQHIGEVSCVNPDFGLSARRKSLKVLL